MEARWESGRVKKTNAQALQIIKKEPSNTLYTTFLNFTHIENCPYSPPCVGCRCKVAVPVSRLAWGDVPRFTGTAESHEVFGPEKPESAETSPSQADALSRESARRSLFKPHRETGGAFSWGYPRRHLPSRTLPAQREPMPDAPVILGTDEPTVITPPPAPSPTPAAPPAAATVLTGKRREGETDLAAELAAKLKARELRLAELEDENHRLKSVPVPKDEPTKKHWLEGHTFFG